MSTEWNKALVHRFWEEFNNGNVDAMMELISPHGVDHSLPPGFPPGPEGSKQLISMYLTAFPDIKMSIEDTIAEGDTVVTRFSSTGTNTGSFMGIPATNKQVTVTGIHILRVEEGKLVEHWSNQDDLGMLQQLGAIPTPDQFQASA